MTSEEVNLFGSEAVGLLALAAYLMTLAFIDTRKCTLHSNKMIGLNLDKPIDWWGVIYNKSYM